MTRDEAWKLVEEALPDVNLRRHVLAAEAVMRALAEKLGEDVESWGLAGLLHDLDYAETQGAPERHALRTAEMLEGRGISDDVMRAILAHAEKAPRDSRIANALCATDPTTGFIVACALVRPDKSLASLQLKSVKKRWKDKRFAAGADRSRMDVCTEIGLSRDEFLLCALDAMRGIRDTLAL